MRKVHLFFLLILLSHTSALYAEVSVPAIVGHNMILQRNADVKVWGWADAAESINVEFNKKDYRTIADEAGNWEVTIKTKSAGGPYKMIITGEENAIELENIMLGDVWLCSGQSNMVHNLERHQDRYRDEIEKANYPNIRQIIIPDQPILAGPSDHIKETAWVEANPETVLDFSVIGYFFAKHLYDQYQVPVGLIKSCVGGTPIQAWISEDGLKEFPSLSSTVVQNKDTSYLNDIRRRTIEYSRSLPPPPPDKGLSEEVKWYDPSYIPKGWHTINIPGYWEDQGLKELNGTVWYRRVVNVPASMTGKPARIDMGRIVDADKVYVNGVEIGGVTYQYPQRRYTFDSGILQEGENIIVVKVVNYGGKGGFVPDKPYFLATENDTIDLKGTWQFKVGNVFTPGAGGVSGISYQNQPTALFNGMIAPITDYKIKGALWYQGESNTWRNNNYKDLMVSLINDWRNQWNDKDLPVFYVQLPNFMDVNYLPEESNWAALRNDQLNALEVENTAMVVSLNLGEWNDIHPGNKKPIGDRLALAARNMVYGESDLVYSGPLYHSAEKTGNKAIIHFDHTGSGLVSNDDEPIRWVSIAGINKEFVWANTRIEDNKLVVWNDEIKDPAYVRYAWMDNPRDANLFNKEGLPASPFEAVLYDEQALWKGKKASIVLTYDDAIEEHLENAIPALEANGFRGTFYLTGINPGMANRLNDWKRAANNGHELGNHTLYHPCKGEGRDWVSESNDLDAYSIARMVSETEMMNIVLQALDGKRERTFAFTCGETETGEGSFLQAIKDQFVSMRGVQGKVNTLENIDLNQVYCFVADGKKLEDLIAWAEEAKSRNGMAVILFHGVGGGHTGNVALDDHNTFIEYLKANEEDYWVTTMLEASKHIQVHLED